MIAQSLFSLLAPELTLTIAGAVILILGLSRVSATRDLAAPLAVVSVLIALVMGWYTMTDMPVGKAGLLLTNLTWYVRLIALGVGLVVLLVHWPLATGAFNHERGDLFAMILFSLAGITLTSIADDLVILFLAIELVSVPTYVLVSIGRSDIHAQEAGVKYFFLGAMSAALMVYGFSFLYGASGTTNLSAMQLSADGSFATIGLLLAFAGLSYKVAAVPFHAYAADVYQGAASPVTGLLGFFPKLAGFVAIIKLLMLTQVDGATAGWQLPGIAFTFLWLVAAFTMTVGNVLGLMQHNVKRILAYSSIAHSGYMLIGLLVGPVPEGQAGVLRDGVSAALFYIVIYGLMNLGAFAVLSVLEARGRDAETIDDIAGLARRDLPLAAALAVCCFSLMGMPLTAGFFGKVYIFGAALSAGAENPHQQALIWLAIIGLLNSAIAAAYYLRIIAACFLRAEEPVMTVAPRTGGARLGVAVCCVVILLVGLWPTGLLKLARAARQPFVDTPPARAVALDTNR